MSAQIIDFAAHREQRQQGDDDMGEWLRRNSYYAQRERRVLAAGIEVRELSDPEIDDLVEKVAAGVYKDPRWKTIQARRLGGEA